MCIPLANNEWTWYNKLSLENFKIIFVKIMVLLDIKKKEDQICPCFAIGDHYSMS